jgi:hypothetical protein
MQDMKVGRSRGAFRTNRRLSDCWHSAKGHAPWAGSTIPELNRSEGRQLEKEEESVVACSGVQVTTDS